MKRLISVLILVCLMASFCTVSAFADESSAYAVSDLSGLKAALQDSSIAEIKLTADISDVTEIITIARPVTIYGGDHTLTSTAGRAINVQTSGNVTIKNLKIKCSGERGVNIIDYPAAVVLDGVNVTAANYAVNVALSGSGASVEIIGGDYHGKNVLNLGGTATVTAGNATFTTHDDSTSEGYSTVCVGADAAGSKVTLNGGKLDYKNHAGDSSVSYNFTVNTGEDVSAVLTNNGCEMVLPLPNTSSEVAKIEYGDYYYTFSTLASAIDYASDGEEIALLRDADLGGQIIDVNKNISIDAAGKKITNGAFNIGEGVAVTIVNSGNTEAEIQQLLSGKLPPAPAAAAPAGRVPATGDDSNMMLWGVLLAGFAVVAVLSRKKRTA